MLQVFTDQNEKLERRNQDNQEARTCKICMDEEVIPKKVIIIKPYFQKYFYSIFRCLTFWTLATMPFAAKLASKTFEIVPFVEISFIIRQWFIFRKKINGPFTRRIQKPIPKLHKYWIFPILKNKLDISCFNRAWTAQISN